MSGRWLLGYILMIQAAFQGVIIAHWGIIGNILTLAICCLFLLAVYVQARNIRDLVQGILGTRTQCFAALFVLCLVITMLWGNHSHQAFLSLGQKITFLLIMAVVIDTMRRKQALSSFAWVISGSVTLLFISMLVEYYLGIDLTMLDEQWNDPRDFCQGINHVRMTYFTTIDNIYGTNRLAFYAILPVALGMGLIQTSSRLLPRLIAALLVVIVVFWVILSGSRSGTLAVLITCLTFALLYIRSWKTAIGYTATSSAILVMVFLLLWLLPAGVTSLERIVKNDSLSRMLSVQALNIGLCDKETTTAKPVITVVPEKVITVRNKYKKGITIDEARKRNWKIALEIFLQNPLGGSGFRTSTEEVLARVPETKVTDLHSGYFTVLAEAGLLGTIPLAALLAYALILLFRYTPKLSGETVVWKAVFLSALTGMLAANLTASYLFERHLWVVLAFAAVIEIWNRETELSVIDSN